jgi:hypothetical protein
VGVAITSDKIASDFETDVVARCRAMSSILKVTQTEIAAIA